jgi:2'-5' RNA ligase
MPVQTHRSALAAVPPEEVWGPIQAIRRRHDRQVGRWMPHINLLYPFRPRSDFAASAERLAEACSHVEPFTITLADFRLFRHGSGRCTLWLAPEPAEGLQRLQAALQAAFPDCDDLSRFSAGFTPHLSVGQCPSSREGERLREQLQAGWRPITFTLAEVALLARGETSPFVVEQRVPLARPVRDA